MGAGDNPIDLRRLARPEAAAFRYLAETLGARFAGDTPAPPSIAAAPTSRRARAVTPTAPEPPAGDACALLDKVPVAILVVVGDRVAHINSTAAAVFGYPSAAMLDAAGGLGALFDGQDPAAPGVLRMVASSGRTFAAKVTMAAAAWGGAAAMLFTVVPAADIPVGRPPTAAHRPVEPRDALVTLLDANPDPIAIVTRGGEVAACNRAFADLGGRAQAMRLDDSLAPPDLADVFDAMHLAFVLCDGAARARQPITVGAQTFQVTVGALASGRLACLVFHRTEGGAAAPLHPPSPPANDVCAVPRATASPLWQAVREVRRLVPDAAIVVVEGGDAAGASADRDAETQLLRLALLAVAARAAAGTVVTVGRRGADYTLAVAPQSAALAVAATSVRLLSLAERAGRTLVFGHDGILTLRAGQPRADR